MDFLSVYVPGPGLWSFLPYRGLPLLLDLVETGAMKPPVILTLLVSDLESSYAPGPGDFDGLPKSGALSFPLKEWLCIVYGLSGLYCPGAGELLKSLRDFSRYLNRESFVIKVLAVWYLVSVELGLYMPGPGVASIFP